MASAESLESRCLLSASKGHASAQFADVAVEPSPGIEHFGAQHASANAHQRKKTYPDISGHWEIVTEINGQEYAGSLDLVQHGRKITGSLTNEIQAVPGKLKAKLDKKPKPPANGGAQPAATGSGMVLNTLLDSEIVSLEFRIFAGDTPVDPVTIEGEIYGRFITGILTGKLPLP